MINFKDLSGEELVLLLEQNGLEISGSRENHILRLIEHQYGPATHLVQTMTDIFTALQNLAHRREHRSALAKAIGARTRAINLAAGNHQRRLSDFEYTEGQNSPNIQSFTQESLEEQESEVEEANLEYEASVEKAKLSRKDKKKLAVDQYKSAVSKAEQRLGKDKADAMNGYEIRLNRFEEMIDGDKFSGTATALASDSEIRQFEEKSHMHLDKIKWKHLFAELKKYNLKDERLQNLENILKDPKPLFDLQKKVLTFDESNEVVNEESDRTAREESFESIASHTVSNITLAESSNDAEAVASPSESSIGRERSSATPSDSANLKEAVSLGHLETSPPVSSQNSGNLPNTTLPQNSSNGSEQLLDLAYTSGRVYVPFIDSDDSNTQNKQDTAERSSQGEPTPKRPRLTWARGRQMRDEQKRGVAPFYPPRQK